MSSLDRQIACVKREIAMRASVYPKFVERKKMSQAKADEELATMRDVLSTLTEVQSASPS